MTKCNPSDCEEHDHLFYLDLEEIEEMVSERPWLSFVPNEYSLSEGIVVFMV